jgi:hypothetical protein
MILLIIPVSKGFFISANLRADFISTRAIPLHAGSA